MDFHLAASDPSSAYKAGTSMGILLWVIVLIYNASLFRHKTHHPLSLWAICTLSFGFTTTSLLQQLGSAQNHALLKIANGLFCVVMITASLALAITSLVLILHKDRGSRPKGRSQSIWTLVLSLAGLLLFVGGLVKGGLNAAAFNAKPAKAIELPEFNCLVEAPPKPWADFDFSKQNPVAKAAYMRPDLQIYSILIPEAQENQVKIDPSAYLEVIKTNLSSVAVESKIVKEESAVKVGGLSFYYMETDARINNLDLVYVYYIHIHNGFFYQILTWGTQARRKDVQREARLFAGRFKQIDPERSALSGGKEALKDFRSESFAYSVALSDRPWHAWMAKEKELPEADFAALQLPETVLAVIPVQLGEFKPDFQAVCKAMFSTLNMNWENSTLELIGKQNDKDVESWLFRYQRKVDTTMFLYRYRVILTPNHAYLTGVWRPQTDAADEGKDLEKELDRIQLLPHTASGTPVSPSAPFLNQLGLYYLDKKASEEALPYFIKAAGLKPDASVYADNVAYTYYLLNQPEKALQEIASRSLKLKPEIDLLNTKALAEEKLGKKEECFQTWKTLLAMKEANIGNFEQFIDASIRLDKAAEAKIFIDAQQPARQTLAFKLKIADLLRASEGMPEASLYLDGLKKSEKNVDPADVEKKRAALLYKSGDYQGVIQLCQKMLAEGSHPADFLAWQGHSQWELEWYREAKATFQEILKLRPNDNEAEDAVKRLSGILGQGENKWIIHPIEPVPMPLPVPSEAGDTVFSADYFKGAEVLYLDRVRAYDFQPGKKSRRTQRSLFQIKNQEGIREFSTLTYKFNPLHERIYLNYLTVKGKSGETTTKGDADHLYVLDDTADDMAQSEKVLHIPIRGLEVDCLVDIQITWEDLAPATEMKFVDFSFSSYYPCRRSILVLQAPAGTYQASLTGDIIKQDSESGTVSWHMLNPPVYRYEHAMPADSEIYPAIHLAAKDGDWTKLIRSYLAQIGPKLESGPELKKQAQKLIEGCTEEKDKIRILSRFVQETVNYKAIEFGSRGIIPEDGETTFRNRYGDCKDHAVYLHQLLKAAGITSYLTLVNTEDAISRSLPSMDQFNHMIVAIPEKTGVLYVDATDKSGAVWEQPPEELIGRDVLLLKEEEPSILRIGSPPPENSSTQIKRNLRLNPDSHEVVVTETITFQGYPAKQIRAYYRSMAESEQVEKTNHWLNSTGLKVSCRNVLLKNLERTDLPLELTWEFTSKNGVPLAGKAGDTSLTAFWERHYLELPVKQKRLHPYLLKYGYRFESETTLEGFSMQPAETDSFKKEILQGTISLEAGSSVSSSVMRKFSRISVRPGAIPADSYQETCKSLDQFFHHLESAPSSRLSKQSP